MSEGMFLGRKFSIPYDNSTDKQVASIARAQLSTGTAAPGAVIQVGDTVMAYGVTPQQAKMGDLDMRLRSFEQISNQAQDVVRRNIQWQYGEQVGEIKKSWWRKLLGVPHTETTFKDLYPDSPGSSAASKTPASPPAAASSAPASASPAPKKSKPAAASKPAAKPAAAKPTAATVKPLAVKNTPSKPAAAKPAPASTSPEDMGPSLPTHMSDHMLNAFHNLRRQHHGARPSDMWETSVSRPNNRTFRSTARHRSTDALEHHELSFDGDSNHVIHRYFGPGKTEAVENRIEIGEPEKSKSSKPAAWSPRSLYSYVNNPKDEWAF